MRPRNLFHQSHLLSFKRYKHFIHTVLLWAATVCDTVMMGYICYIISPWSKAGKCSHTLKHEGSDSYLQSPGSHRTKLWTSVFLSFCLRLRPVPGHQVNSGPRMRYPSSSLRWHVSCGEEQILNTQGTSHVKQGKLVKRLSKVLKLGCHGIPQI